MVTTSIKTNDGEMISVDAKTSAADIATLKVAAPCRFQEFHYTGNHPRGENSGNYEDVESWLWESGLTLKNDDLSILLYSMGEITGIEALRHRGKTLRYHVQRRNAGPGDQYGYTTITEYRLISCE